MKFIKPYNAVNRCVWKHTKKIISSWIALLISCHAIQLSAHITTPYQKIDNVQVQLRKAIDYYQGGKYAEALLLFLRIEKSYRLHPRYSAFMSVCYFYEKDYQKVKETMLPVWDKLTVYSPVERRLYQRVLGVSLLELSDYQQAIPFLESYSVNCTNTEKSLLYYMLSRCYAGLELWEQAHEYIISAKAYQKQYQVPPFPPTISSLALDNEIEHYQKIYQEHMVERP